MRGWGGTEAFDLSEYPTETFVRFWAKINKNAGPWHEGTKCWTWVGKKNVIRTKPQNWQVVGTKRMVLVNRVAYALTVGPIPVGHVLVQTCSTTACVRHWRALSFGEAARLIKLRTTDLPVEAIRRARSSGANCEAITYVFEEVGHRRAQEVMDNKTFVDPTYEAPPRRSRREEHPSLFRFSKQEMQDIRSEFESGTSIYKISKWANAPMTTVWEALNGPSTVARRKKLA